MATSSGRAPEHPNLVAFVNLLDRHSTVAARLAALRRTGSTLLPSAPAAERFIDRTLGALFPQLATESSNDAPLPALIAEVEQLLLTALEPLHHSAVAPQPIGQRFIDRLPEIATALYGDAVAVFEADPAASSLEEVILVYPGFHAMAVYRIAHHFYRAGVPVFPRMLTEIAHRRTGIDIHPGAQIAGSCFVDHGSGVVIGETATVGHRVRIHQGVTLGALTGCEDRAGKRHPTVEDRVVIYPNATILGGDTVIGHDTVIGGNVWLTSSVPPHSAVYAPCEILSATSQRAAEPHRLSGKRGVC